MKDALGLITFFTVGDKETRAWTLRDGQTALEAAATIHTDIARGFIRCEVILTDDLLDARLARRGRAGAERNGSRARPTSSRTATFSTSASTCEPVKAAALREHVTRAPTGPSSFTW